MRTAYTRTKTTEASPKSQGTFQAPVNPAEFAMDASAAVHSPRINFEGDVVHVEHGFDAAQVAAFRSRVTQAEV